VDPDPVGSETFRKIRIRIQIREKDHYGSGQLRIRNEFEIKLLLKTDKIRQFLNKNAQFKDINSFLSTKISLETLQPNTLTRRENNGKIYVNLIKDHVGFETN
jgi:hypothetical protein